MKNTLKLIAAICISLFAASASAQYIPVTTPSSCITDGSGAPMASGTMIIVGTDANDNPIPYRAGTSLMSTTSPISRTITTGALATSLQLADPGSTSPTGVLYRFAIKDNNTSKITLYKQIVVSINDLGTNFNFCKMNPLPFTTQIQFAAAPFSFSGDWNLLGNLTVAKSFDPCAATVTFSATPTFNAGICNGFKITLTANVTSSTLSGATFGEPLFFEVCQDATGSRTFVPPSNVTAWTTINSAALSCTLQFYWYDGTNAQPDVMPGLTGDVTSGVGSTVTTVVKVNGVSYPAGPSTHSVPVVTASNTVTYKVIPDCQSIAGKLTYTQSSDTFGCSAATPSFQKFTASGTFTIPVNVTCTRVTVLGGGGGAGGSTTTAIGGGGASGSLAIKEALCGLTPANTITVTVGANGTGGVNNAAGTAGGTSSIASGTQTITTITAPGGGGGASVAGLTAGGTHGAVATNGDFNTAGNDGMWATAGSTFSGLGGSSFPFGGGGSMSGTAGVGNAATGLGAGGGGANSGANGTGGAGTGGMVLFEWFN